MNDEAVYRTAPATPGLLIIIIHDILQIVNGFETFAFKDFFEEHPPLITKPSHPIADRKQHQALMGLLNLQHLHLIKFDLTSFILNGKALRKMATKKTLHSF